MATRSGGPATAGTGPAGPGALSPERILAAAFVIADEAGLDAVTMRAVAAALGVEAMSLYHHVPNKRALLDGLVDLVVRRAALPDSAPDVASWVRGTAAALRSVAVDHPRLLPLFGSRPLPLADPAAAVPFEAGLALLVDAGRTLAEAFAAVQAVTVALLGLAQLQAVAQLQQLAGEPGAGDPGAAEQSLLAGLPADRFPLLRQVPDVPVDLDDFWATLVEALVAGLSTAARP